LLMTDAPLADISFSAPTWYFRHADISVRDIDAAALRHFHYCFSFISRRCLSLPLSR
jgi:hypothetical protein